MGFVNWWVEYQREEGKEECDGTMVKAVWKNHSLLSAFTVFFFFNGAKQY